MKSTYGLLGWPDAVSYTVVVLLVIMAVAPYLPPTDFGLLKIPDLPSRLKKTFKYIGIPLLVVALLGYWPLWSEGDIPAKAAVPNDRDSVPVNDAEEVEADCRIPDGAKANDLGFVNIDGRVDQAFRMPKEMHIYHVGVYSGERLSIEAQDTSNNLDLSLCLKFGDSSRSLTTQSGSSFTRLTYNAQNSGTYLLKVWNSRSGVGGYQLRLRDLVAESGSPISYGHHAAGSFHGNQEVDVYSFEGKEKDRISLLVHDPDDSDGVVQPQVELVRASGPARIDVVDYGGGAGTVALNEELPESGSYKILLKNKLGTAGSYFICLQNTSSLVDSEEVGRARSPVLRGVFFPVAFMTPAGTSSPSPSGSDVIVLVVRTPGDDKGQVYHAKPGEVITVQSKSASFKLGLKGSVWKNKKGADIDLVRIVDGGVRRLDRFSLKIGEKYRPKNNLLGLVELGDIAHPEDSPQTKVASGHGCCVSCGGTRACGCAISMDCGDCCVPPCCDYGY